VCFTLRWASISTPPVRAWGAGIPQQQHLLHDLCVTTPASPLLFCDNKSALFLSSNPVSHKLSKHIDLDYHFLRELVIAVTICTQHVPSHIVDCWCFHQECLSSLFFSFFCFKLLVCSNPMLSLWGGGDVKDTQELILSWH